MNKKYQLITLLFSYLFITHSLAGKLEVEGPTLVKAGEEVKVKLEFHGIINDDAILKFGSMLQKCPRVYKIYEPQVSDLLTEDAMAYDGYAIVNDTDEYKTLFKTDNVPKFRDRIYFWVRSKGANICIKDAYGKELKWSWAKPENYRWISLGGFDRSVIKDGFAIFSAKPSKELKAASLDCVLLVSDPDYNPNSIAGNDPFTFTWQTNESSLGKHAFPVQIAVGSKIICEDNYEINVISENKESSGQLFTEIETVKINNPNLKCYTDDFRLRLFNDNSLKSGINEFGKIDFDIADLDGNAGMIALKSQNNAHKIYGVNRTEGIDFPEKVQIDINESAKGLLFLHSELGNRSIGEEVFRYKVVFDDDSEITIPVIEGEGICGTQQTSSASNASEVYNEFNGIMTTTVYMMPYVLADGLSEKQIKYIEAISANTSSLPLVMGISLAKNIQTENVDMKPMPKVSCLTVDYKIENGQTISENLFGINDSFLNRPNISVDESRYQDLIREIAPGVVRLHMGYSMKTVFPDVDSTADFTRFNGLLRTFEREDRKGQKIIFCFAGHPKWVKMSDSVIRSRYVDCCMQVVEYLDLKGVNIDYWQLSNEPYCGSGVNDGGAYWDFYNELGQLIHDFNPAYKVGGPVVCFPDLGVIKDFLANCYGNIDFVAWHWYPTGSIETPTRVLMSRTKEFGDRIRGIRELTLEYPNLKDAEFMMSEFNMNYDWQDRDPRQANHVGSCWLASIYKHMAEAELDISTIWQAAQDGTFGILDDDIKPRPNAALIMLMNRYFKNAIIVKDVCNNEKVEALACINDDSYLLMLINKDNKNIELKTQLLNGPSIINNELIYSTLEYNINETENLYGCSKIRFFEEDPIEKSVNLLPYSVRLYIFKK